MNKDLIERLLDNRVTGFNLTVAAVEAADLIEAQAAQIELMREALNRLLHVAPADLECNNMHHLPKHRHTYDETCPVVIEYVEATASAREALATTPNEALQAFAEKVREQCAQVCESLDDKQIGGWYECASAIRNLKEQGK